MPKIKTRKAAAKRFQVSGSGKLVRRKVRKSHLLSKKSSEQKRRLSVQAEMAPADVKAARRSLGI